MPVSREEALAKVREVGERLKALRAKQSSDSPYAGTSFALACLIGDMERELSIELPTAKPEAQK